MSDNLEGWKTQKESKHAVHHVESPFGGETVASRKEMEVHRMSDSLSEKARRDLVQAKMAALAKSIIDTEREYFIKTLWQLNLTQEERADLVKLLREQGIEHLLPGPGEETGERRKGGATYMAIRKYHIIPGTGEEFLHRVQAGFVPIISRIPGFIAYDALQVGNDQIVSISVFDTPLGVIESTPRALQWVQENIAGLIQGMPEVMAGQIGASSELDRVYGKARKKLFRKA
jgi:hypothetical protein